MKCSGICGIRFNSGTEQRESLLKMPQSQQLILTNTLVGGSGPSNDQQQNVYLISRGH